MSAIVETIETKAILEILPQKYPFLFVDRILTLIPFQMVKASKAITFNEWYFQGHFPQAPILPGNIIIEMMAQTAGLLAFNPKIKKEQAAPKAGYLVKCQVKFYQKVQPGVLLEIEARKKVLTTHFLSASVRVLLLNSEVASGELDIAL